MSRPEQNVESQIQPTSLTLTSSQLPYVVRITRHILRFKSLMLFFIAFSAVFSLYTLTLAPGVIGGDSGEHQLAVPLLSIPHTTGYPLYILAGKLWTMLIPIGIPGLASQSFLRFGRGSGSRLDNARRLPPVCPSLLHIQAWRSDFKQPPWRRGFN